MPKFIGYITLRMNSTRIPNKIIQHIGTRSLVNRGIRCLTQVHDISQVVVYANRPRKYIDYQDVEYQQKQIWAPKIIAIDRDPKFDENDVTFNNILDSIIDIPPIKDADYIVYLSVTSPFITPRMIHYMIEAMQLHGNDSAFLATEQRVFAWYKGKPLYDTKHIARTQDLIPLIIETSSCYIFRRDWYKKTGKRIGKNPFILTVDKLRGLDIDTPDELELARRIADGLGW